MSNQRSRAQEDDVDQRNIYDWYQQHGQQAGYFNTTLAPAPPPKPSAADKIRARLAEKREEYADFLRHLDMRRREEDARGMWYASINASEVSSFIDGLVFCLEALGEKP